MKFSVGVEYAIHCLVYMSEYYEQKSISIIELAEFQGVSESYLSKVFTKLSKQQIVKSVPGIKGGYMLARNPKTINFWEVIEAVEGKSDFFVCKEIRQTSQIAKQDLLTTSQKNCPCLVKVIMNEAQEKMREYLRTKTIYDLQQNVYNDYYNDDQVDLIKAYFDKHK